MSTRDLSRLLGLSSGRTWPGVYLAIEGVDGVGKTTVARELVPLVREATGEEPLLVREPGSTVLAENVRRVMLDVSAVEPLDRVTELHLMSAMRSHLIRRVIRPALEAGRIVLTDRFALSSFAYQGGEEGISDADIAAITRIAIDGCWPDRTVVLSLDAAERDRRRIARGLGGDAFETDSRMERAATRYMELAKELPGIAVVSASGSPIEVARRVLEAISPVLRQRVVGPAVHTMSHGVRVRR